MKKKIFQIFQLSSESQPHRFLFYLLLTANILSLAYFLIFGFYNRPALDDYCYLSAQNENGFLSPFTFWYQNWQGRFAPIFLINAFLKIYDLVPSLLQLTILLLTSFIWVIYKLLSRILIYLSRFELLNLSAFVTSVFVINNYEFNTFYWLNASAMYFGGVLCLLIGLNEILSKRANFWHFLALSVCAIFVGSSSETFALIWAGVSGLVLLTGIALKSKVRFSRLLIAKLSLAFAFCLISFMVMYLAPGNAVRLKITSLAVHQTIPLPLNELSGASMHALVVFCAKTLPKIPIWLLLCFPFVYIGSRLKQNNWSTVNLKLIIVTFIALVIICLVPTVYVQGNIGPSRALTHVACYITAFLIIISLIIGERLQKRPGLVWIAAVSVALWILMLIGDIRNNVPEASKYAKSEDTRLTYLRTFENKFVTDTLSLNPLHRPILHEKINDWVFPKQKQLHYVLQPNEIKPPEQDFVNDCICRGLHLEFHLKLKADSTDQEHL